MARKVKLSSRGIAAAARSGEVRAEVNKLAEKVADHVRGQGHWVDGIPGDVALPVKVDEQTTDRARAQVQLAHPAGLAVQAKHGALTRAAAAVGLEVKSR